MSDQIETRRDFVRLTSPPPNQVPSEAQDLQLLGTGYDISTDPGFKRELAIALRPGTGERKIRKRRMIKSRLGREVQISLSLTSPSSSSSFTSNSFRTSVAISSGRLPKTSKEERAYRSSVRTIALTSPGRRAGREELQLQKTMRI